MATTLVIKNTNFSANKLDTVTFGGNVPCTGITLAVDSISLTEEGQTADIEYVLTPEDTTDVAVLTSDNTGVVTVSGNTITAVGVGTATVTIACGNQTATVSVTCTMIMERYFKTGYYAEKGGSGTYAIEDTAANWGYCGAENTWGDGRYIATKAAPYIPVYKIPNGSSAIQISVPSGWKSLVLWFDSTQEGGGTASRALLIEGETTGTAVLENRTVSVPDGADSLGIAYRTTTQTFDPSALTGYNVTFVSGV